MIRQAQISLFTFWLCSTLARAQPVEAQLTHPVSGRQIAPVMGVGGAGWLERAERETEERPKLAIQLLDIEPGMVVADVGAGSGYYTVMLAAKVGSSGKVFASDIQRGMLDLLNRRLAREKIRNVETLLATGTDPKLPLASCDLILLVDVYHELSEPQAMLRKLRAALKPDGRLVLLEFRQEDPNVPIRPEHKMSVAVVRAELEPEGFRFEKVLPDLPWQHILVFRK